MGSSAWENGHCLQSIGQEVAHGLGTYQWLKEDVSSSPLSICQNPVSGYVEASISNNVLLFLHGFLGQGIDWIPVMKAFSKSARCISLDLPGHGRSMFKPLATHNASQEDRLSVDDIAGTVYKVVSKIVQGKVTLVGFSMGARIALYMALRLGAKIRGAIIIYGSPGLQDVTEGKLRAAKDDSRASTLICLGLKSFVESWYAGDLWRSFREHLNFEHVIARRLQHHDVEGLAKVLSDFSIGRQMSLWEDLKYSKTPLMFIYGQKDKKMKKILSGNLLGNKQGCNL